MKILVVGNGIKPEGHQIHAVRDVASARPWAPTCEIAIVYSSEDRERIEEMGLPAVEYKDGRDLEERMSEKLLELKGRHVEEALANSVDDLLRVVTLIKAHA